MTRILTLLFLMILPVLAHAQDAGNPSLMGEIEGLLNDAEEEPVVVPAGNFGEDPFGMTLPVDFVADEATGAATQDAVRAFYDYRTEGFAHRMAVFRWQHLSSQILFFVVIGIVGVGLYFSWLQFHETKDKNAMPTTSIEAGKEGFKVSSPVLGVIILVLSLAFFYLYLVHVYPISETF